jgi:quercetin dioxygenase-like cupin family protein
MDEATFRAKLAAEGFPEPQLVEKSPADMPSEHAHDFTATALILAGEFSVVTRDGTTTCRAGDTFTLAAGVPHYERYGAEGARFLISRKTP